MRKLFVIFSLIMLSLGVKAQTALNQRVLFKPDSVNIMPSQTAQIEVMADYMKKHPDTTIIVAGFVSSLTNLQNAEQIAQQRADIVAGVLINSYYIPSQRLIPIGVGRGTRYEQEEFNEVVSFFKK